MAELLLSLTILAVIATFTIPKVLNSQQDGTFNAIAMETAAMVSGAYDVYRLEKGATDQTRLADLTPYMNYTRYVTDGTQIDSGYTQNVRSCSSGKPCIFLATGAGIQLGSASFGGTDATNAIRFAVDPDGKVTDGTTNGPGKSVWLRLYYNGRITSRAHLLNPTCDSSGCTGPQPGFDPPWLKW